MLERRGVSGLGEQAGDVVARGDPKEPFRPDDFLWELLNPRVEPLRVERATPTIDERADALFLGLRRVFFRLKLLDPAGRMHRLLEIEQVDV